MKKNYNKPNAVVVEMSFSEHIAASGEITCTYTGNEYMSSCTGPFTWLNDQA